MAYHHRAKAMALPLLPHGSAGPRPPAPPPRGGPATASPAAGRLRGPDTATPPAQPAPAYRGGGRLPPRPGLRHGGGAPGQRGAAGAAAAAHSGPSGTAVPPGGRSLPFLPGRAAGEAAAAVRAGAAGRGREGGGGSRGPCPRQDSARPTLKKCDLGGGSGGKNAVSFSS